HRRRNNRHLHKCRVTIRTIDLFVAIHRLETLMRLQQPFVILILCRLLMPFILQSPTPEAGGDLLHESSMRRTMAGILRNGDHIPASKMKIAATAPAEEMIQKITSKNRVGRVYTS